MMNTRRVSSRLLPLLLLLLTATATLIHAQSSAVTLRGTITDPFGASVPNATVVLRGASVQRAAKTDANGQYAFTAVPAGHYVVRVVAKGFTPNEMADVDLSASKSLDLQMKIEVDTQVVNVEDSANTVNVDPSSNGGAVTLGEKELNTLSDDPDELSQQLQALAGPSAGPDGGQIFIDGFTGGNLPPKASIREVRINSNPFAPEYDRPGFGRIEIFTKPGTDNIRGQAFMQWNKEALNSRSPLLTSSTRPPYQQKFFGGSLSGPLVKQKASFSLDVEHRSIDENAFILATTLDSKFNPVAVNQGIVTPQSRTTVSPKVDYQINASNTLSMRYMNMRSEADNEGVGDYSLVSKAYTQSNSENSFQITETAILSPHAINESRFQFMRSRLSMLGDNTTPGISVQGAFTGGGAQIGNSGTTTNSWEWSNMTSYTRGTHAFKWGGRLRQSFLDDRSENNFGGSYSFFGGTGPALDASNNPIAGTSIDLTALEVYRRTLLFQSLGYTNEQIRALGGGAAQFSLSAGQAASSVKQFDIGLYVNDDWKIKPNLTFSYGVRYETQTNISDFKNWSPRVALAWGLDGNGKRSPKTVLRTGFGVFYDRVTAANTLSALRFNGVTQQSYLVINPTFFPVIPTADQLAAYGLPQQLKPLAANIDAPRVYQTTVSLERQVTKSLKLTGMYMYSRGNHLLRTRNVNAPVNGVYPYGDEQLRLLTESSGSSRSNQLIVSPNFSYKKMFLFGFYSYSHGQADNEGQPADPYNLKQEWGPSSYADIRHRLILGTSIPAIWGISVSPFLAVSSGAPFNITTGRDTNGDGATTERPALLTGVAATDCTGSNLVYKSGYGCFDLLPTAGMAIIGRNSGRGPATVNLNLRVARTWGFGSRKEANGNENNGMPPGPPPGGGGGPRGGGPGGGGPPPGGGPPGGMFGGNSGKRYSLTLSVQARNILNHANYATPSGDLSSPYFGVSRSLAGFGPFGGSSTYNRKIDLQLRFSF